MRLLEKLLARFSKRWARVPQQLGQIELKMAREESGQLPKRQVSNLEGFRFLDWDNRARLSSVDSDYIARMRSVVKQSNRSSSTPPKRA
jgi:hypothetical protein